MSKHTPGPWKCVAAEFGEDGTENEGLVAFWVRMPKPCISMAHADVIAAAPELLEALKENEWSNGGRCPQCGRFPRTKHQPKCVVGLAIARAEGGQS